MLTKNCLWSVVSSAIFCCCCESALADDKKLIPVTLQFDPVRYDDYSYRKTNHEKTIKLMLYGFHDQGDAPAIQKMRKDLGGFFKQHIDNSKDQSADGFHLVNRSQDFDSTQINRGLNLEPAKMTGFTAPYGHLTFGGGYTWGEKNPALMRLTKADGMFTGVSYDTGNVGYQLSYLKSGYRLAGLKVGSGKQYGSLMLGTSFRVTERMGMTATIQYRNDQDPLTTGTQQTIFTVGTKWKF